MYLQINEEENEKRLKSRVSLTPGSSEFDFEVISMGDFDDKNPNHYSMTVEKLRDTNFALVTEPTHKEEEINDFSSKETIVEKLSPFSMYQLRFGVFIKNTTTFVNKVGLLGTMISLAILFVTVYEYYFQIGDVRSCCNQSYLNAEDALFN